MQLGIVKLLRDDATVAGLVGARIYPSVKPQSGAFPCVVYSRVDGIRDYHHKGPSGLVNSRLQIDIYATSYPLTKQVHGAIVAVLNGYSGTVAGSGWSYRFDGIFLTGRDDEEVIDGVGGADRLYRTSLDLNIQHTE